MKNLNVVFDDEDYEKLREAKEKGDYDSWREFFLETCVTESKQPRKETA